MPFKGQQSVIANHAAAVVGDLDQLFSTSFDLDTNAGGGGVESIFEELFHHGCRPLNDFASSNLIGNGFGKDVDLSHGNGGSWSVSQMITGKAKRGQVSCLTI